jgi:rifampicin phosphotransferase
MPSRAPIDECWIVPLAEADAAGTGGKATNLARLHRLGLPVPRGFAIAAPMLQRLLEMMGLAGAPPDSLQTLIPRASIPSELWQPVVRAWRALGVSRAIVRSSALGEDSDTASFAGQLDSIADVTSEEALARALVRCWASRWSARVLAYERSRGRALAGMGVIVQEQIRASISGVMFTMAPDAADAMLIEYCAGAGEALVSGRVNPGRVAVDRVSGSVRRLARAEDPGCRLDDPCVHDLAGIGRRVETAFGSPQDIEWTVDAGNRIWIVQSRPITTSAGSDVRANRSEDAHEGPKTLWSNANVNENFPDPICPLLYSVASAGYYHYFRNLGRAFGLTRRRLEAIDAPLHRIIGVHRARMYYNLSSIHTVLRAAPFGESLAASFNRFVGADELAPRNPKTTEPAGVMATIGHTAELARIFAAVLWQYAFFSRRVARFERTVDAFAAATRPADLPRHDRADLLRHLRGFMEIRCHRWKDASLADAGAMVSYAALQAQVRRALPSADQDALHNTLLKALPDLVSSRPAVELWLLSRLIRNDRHLRALFAGEPPDRILEELRRRPELGWFVRAFDAYLEQWGYRCSAELMLTVPGFQEDPAALIAILKSYAVTDGESPSRRLERQQAERVAETRRVLRSLSPVRAAAVRMLLKWTQRAIQLRERARLKQALLYSRLRRIALAVGDRLVADGRLDRRDDVFMLTVEEIDALLSGDAMFPDLTASLARLRRDEHTRIAATRPPDTFTLADGTYVPIAYTQDEESAPEASAAERGAVLTGTSACGGRATARAVVLADVTEAHRLAAGDILITRQTDPGWGPVFPLITGLVMERGGMLSHGAIIAREFGIPSIVGVRDATRVIPSGTTVSLDGDRGIVRIVAEATCA